MVLFRPFCALVLSAGLLALSACTTVGPDYVLPEESVFRKEGAASEFVSASESAYVADELPDDWWRLYDQKVLNEVVEMALAANTDLRIAAANLLRAQAIIDEARSMADPAFGAGAGVTYGRSATAHGTRRQADHWSYDAGLAVSYQLDLFGKIARAIEAATADMEATRAAHDLVRITVVADTTRAWLGICASGHQLAVAQHSVSLQESVVATTVRLEEGGRATQLDVSRARAQLEQLKAAVPPLIAQQRTAIYQLAVLTGNLPAALPERATECRAIPQLSRPVPVGDGAMLLSRRPDIRQVERLLAGATARIGVATADLYPSISLGLNVGQAGVLSSFGSGNAFHWGIGPFISWVIPATGPARARISQAEAAAQAALADFDGVVLNALKEVESALTLYARELDRNAALRDARDQSALASRQAHQLYTYGRTDFLTTLDADRTLAEFESRLAESDAQQARYLVSLFLALGGGWNAAPAEETAATAGQMVSENND